MSASLEEGTEEKMFFIAFSRMGPYQTPQFFGAVRVYKDGRVINHPNNSRISVYAQGSTEGDKEPKMVIRGHEPGDQTPWKIIETITLERNPDVPDASRRAYQWVKERTERLATREGIGIDDRVSKHFN